MDPTSKPKDPVYSAIVRDPSGYCRLIYRANNNCRPSNVKKGKFYRMSGKMCKGGMGACGRGAREGLMSAQVAAAVHALHAGAPSVPCKFQCTSSRGTQPICEGVPR